MAVKLFRFIAFDPGVLHPEARRQSVIAVEDDADTPDDANFTTANGLVLDVTRPAPDAVKRDVLRTRIFAHHETPHDAFGLYSASHDKVGHYFAYLDSDNGSDDDEADYRAYITPIRFLIYELGGASGHAYATTPLGVLKDVHRRYRTGESEPGALFRMRAVNVRNLEEDCGTVCLPRRLATRSGMSYRILRLRP